MKKPTIGIVTFYFSDNYGAALQSWALQRWFNKNGCDARFVPYHPAHVEEGGDFFVPRCQSDFRKLAKVVYLKISFLRNKYFGDKIQGRRFSIFRKNSLGISSESYRNRDEMKAAKLNYQLVVCGSDQIWNPSDQYGVDSVYYGDVPTLNPARTISYAASFGTSSVGERWLPDIKRNVERLDAVSVREPYAVDLLERSANVNSMLVPDPVILLGYFDDLLKESEAMEDIGIFCYSLRTDNGTRQLSSALNNKYGCGIVSPHNPHRRWPEIGQTLYCGPCEWVMALSKAKFVVTNSFHGVAFSILFKKNFVAVGLSGGKEGLNDRMLSLLKSCNLMDRFVEAANAVSALPLFERAINWQDATDYIKASQSSAGDWLKKQIELSAHD